MRSRADGAFRRADYVFAADQYDKLAERAPGDAALRDQRDQARARALVTLTTRIKQLRSAGRAEAALASLADLLVQRRGWIDGGDPAAQRAIADEVAAAGSYLHDEIQHLITDGQPLAAEEAIEARHAQLPARELETLWPLLLREAQDGGRTICRRTAPGDIDESPYLAQLTARYCAHFEIAAHAPVSLPDVVSGLATEGAVSGMTDAQRMRLHTALEDALRATPWFDAGAGHAQVRVAVAGHQAVAYGSSQVERTAPWSEAVSYTERESFQEPYQEMYQESYQQSYQESYTTQVPYTNYRTESYSCGFGTSHSTCTRSVPSTSYRTETHYRTAHRPATRTAWRTAYRTAWRNVTKTRHEARTFRFTATERVGNYSGSWRLAIAFGEAAAPLDAGVDDAHRDLGYDHDALFAPANVTPSRAQLLSFDDWFARLLAQLSATLPARLARHWSTSFCQMPRFSAETAARCGYGAQLPAAARDELVRLYGADVDRVIARFVARPLR